MTTYMYPYKKGAGWRSQGFRSNPGSPYNPPGGHTGYDEAMPAGTPIYAPCDGIIRNSGWLTDNYLANPWWLTAMGGDTLVIDGMDANGRTETMPTFIFAHLQDSTAPVGKRVKKGELIGLSGNSGTATTGPHIHIEALPPNWDWNNGVYGRVDPESYFSEWPGEVTAQSTPPTNKEPFTVGQYEEIVKKLDRVEAIATQTSKDAKNTHAGVWKGGSYNGQTFNYGILPIVAHSQRLEAENSAVIKNLISALAKVVGGEKFDEAKLLAGVKDSAKAGTTEALAEGIVNVDVTVNGAPQ